MLPFTDTSNYQLQSTVCNASPFWSHKRILSLWLIRWWSVCVTRWAQRTLWPAHAWKNTGGIYDCCIPLLYPVLWAWCCIHWLVKANWAFPPLSTVNSRMTKRRLQLEELLIISRNTPNLKSHDNSDRHCHPVCVVDIRLLLEKKGQNGWRRLRLQIQQNGVRQRKRQTELWWVYLRQNNEETRKIVNYWFTNTLVAV